MFHGCKSSMSLIPEYIYIIYFNIYISGIENVTLALLKV